MRRYDSQDARRRVLAACARLFLERGYTQTRMVDILREADVSASSFQNIFGVKSGVLTALVEIMFSGQFDAARALTADAPTPAHVYAVETALQLALTELNENVRDIYLEAYTCPDTLALIYRRTAGELQAAFGAYLPEATVADFLEMPYSHVRVIKSTMGGSFGGKQEWFVEPVAALAARQLRRPVKLVYRREDAMLSTVIRGAFRGTLQGLYSPEGRILGFNVELLADAGAYFGNTGDYFALRAASSSDSAFLIVLFVLSIIA